MSSSLDTSVPIIVLVILVTLIGVIYGTLELYDNESSAWDVLKDLLSGKITLWDIWEGKGERSGVCAGPDKNAAYMYNENGDCTFIGCKPGYFEQNGICIQQRDRSDDVYGGQEAVNCEYDGYESVSTCILKDPNVTCGIGVGTIQKQPKVVKSAIGGGSCPGMIEVDCDKKCPNICTIDKDEAYTEVEGGKVKASYEGRIVDLGKDTGFCGTGTTTREYNPRGISNQFLLDSGYASLQEYLDVVNPGNVCQGSEPYIVDVPCEIGDNGEPMRDVSCSYGLRIYEPIKSKANTGEPACFNTSVAEDFIAGNITFSELQEGELPIITPDDVPLNDDGEYDWSQVSDDKRKGRRILYLSGLGISAEKLQGNKCTLMTTQECDARIQDVDCVIGEILDRGDCSDTVCDNNQQQSLTWGVVTRQFGNGKACDKYTPVTYLPCTTQSIDCCTDADYKKGDAECEANGYVTYTLDTTNCEKNGLPETKEVPCCYQSGWEPVTGYEGCEFKGNIWKRKYTRTVTDGCTGDDAITEKYEYNDDCNYDCEYTADYGGKTCYSVLQDYSCGTAWNHAVNTTITREAKGSGTCPSSTQRRSIKTLKCDKGIPCTDYLCNQSSLTPLECHSDIWSGERCLATSAYDDGEDVVCPSQPTEPAPTPSEPTVCEVIDNRLPESLCKYEYDFDTCVNKRGGPANEKICKWIPEPTERGGGWLLGDSPDGISTGGRR